MTAMLRNDRAIRRGFTLIEILMVVLVLAIVAAIVIPSIGTADDGQAISAARALQSDLEVARSLAMMTQVPHAVVFNTSRQSYKVVANYMGGDYSTAVAIVDPVRPGGFMEVTLAARQGMPSVTVVSAFGGAGAVTFTSLGEPLAGGSVTLRAGQTEMVITVEELTGIITTARTAG